jgi:hypothetical protein
MAIDKSEPKVGLIFRIGLLVIVLLVATRALLNSYFDQIATAEEERKVGEAVPSQLLDLRADEERRLTSGAMPIDKAMMTIVGKGRTGASPDIMPSASRDLAPVQGWSKMPGEVPPGMMAPPPEAAVDAGAPAAAPPGDAGARAPSGPVPRKPKKQP